MERHNKEHKTIGAGTVFAWIFSVLFIVGGIGMLFETFFAGILIFIAGVIILPPFNKILEKRAKLKLTAWLKIIIVLVLLMFAGLALPEDPETSQDNGGGLKLIDNSNSQNTQTTTPIETTTTPTPSIEEKSNGATMGEKNALSQALSYLRYTAFSYSGLIKQLEYEGYSHTEAVYGVDNCGADWNEQAVLKAQSYLDYSAFSREGLIKQLDYEGFTSGQAEYGVQAVGY